MTRKDYIKIAEILNKARENGKESHAFEPVGLMTHFIACQMADMLLADNPRFDRSRFLKACGY